MTNDDPTFQPASSPDRTVRPGYPYGSADTTSGAPARPYGDYQPSYDGGGPTQGPTGWSYGSPGWSPQVFYGPPLIPPTPPRRSRRKSVLMGAGAAAVAAALVVSGVAVGRALSPQDTSGSASANQPTIYGPGSTSGSGSSGSGSTGTLPGWGGSNGSATGGTGSGSTSQGDTSTSGTTAATAKQTAGIVTVVSVLKYQSAEAAGTGMILTSNGEILTNNHVVDGATSITVTVESTDRSYTATVVGTDPTDDVAVLQLKNASGLTTAKTASASEVRALSTGQKVIGVGNAAGTGALRSSAGTVTALNQSITAGDETGQNSEKLTGLIETNANIISGDSGGPLYNSSGKIVGMDTAGSSASSAGQGSTGTAQVATTAYAITITKALSVADQIESGTETSTIHIGLPAFLGVGVAETDTGGAGISSVVANGPAAGAGITAGDTVTAVGGHAVASATALGTVLAGYQPGQSVSITWIDTTGASHTASVTLISGPAD